MNQSTNYNFNLPEGSDLVNLLTQLIPNWSSLDTILKGVQDATFSSATETVSLNVHAITRSNPDSKLLRWIATANFEAGDTFTIDGISTPAALPSGESLGEDAYIAGSTVIAALNSDESLLTVFVTSGAVAVAADSERLGGELPAYYSTKSYADGIKTTADNAAAAIALKSLVNTYYNNVTNKLFEVNADGTVGNEIKVGGDVMLDFDNPLYSFDSTHLSYTCAKDCYVYGYANTGRMTANGVAIDMRISSSSSADSFGVPTPLKFPAGTTFALTVGAVTTYKILDVV